MDSKIKALFDAFDTADEFVSAETYGGGHINDTYKITAKHGKYTLQRINDSVFASPRAVMENICAVTEHISKKLTDVGLDPSRRTLAVVLTKKGEPLYVTDHGAYRMFTFVDGVKTYKKSENTDIMRSAATAFGMFERMLLDFSAETLNVTIPDFHNTPKRYADLCRAAENDVCGRAEKVAEELEYFKSESYIYGAVTEKLYSGELPLRVAHNDTKLDNVLFDEETDEAICVIDLDTVMPGSIIYDYGDALRCGTNSALEDSENASGVECRLDMLRAFTDGYLNELGDVLTDEEISLLPIAGRLVTLECAMRFLTDYLSGDVYFRVSRPNQNLDRARVGIALARDMKRKQDDICRIITEILQK